jgi:uncharacterized hydrophobic protein (TIGR00271 family)
VIHLRLVVPAAVSGPVVDFLCADPRATNVAVLRGAALDPVGDVVLCDVAREATSEVIEHLRGLGLDAGGSIAIEQVDASPSEVAERAERAAPGAPDDAIVWDLVLARAQEDARPSWSYYAFMTLATLIAAVAVVTDSSVLLVGAMVVGPEFGPVAAVAAGLVLGRGALVARSLRLLVLGFAAAIAVTVVLGALAGLAGWVDAAQLTEHRVLTGFIWRPDRWSFVVALLAGAAGVLSLTAGRANALVGVFISVTTVPAAGNLALALALGVPGEIGGAAAQLGINLACLVLAGTAVLAVQRAAAAQRRPRPGGRVISP